MRGTVRAAVLLGALVVTWAGVVRAGESPSVESETPKGARDQIAIGAIAAFDLGPPLIASAGVAASFAMNPFFALGGELSAFTMASPGEYYQASCPDCVHNGFVTRAFGELRSPWSSPVNLFARLSAGLLLAKRNDGGAKAVPTVRLSGGPELRVWHVYLEPFVFAENKVDVQAMPFGLGLEIGAAF